MVEVVSQTADNPLNIVDAYNAACDENRQLLQKLQELECELKNARVACDALVAVFLARGEVIKKPEIVPEYIVKVDKNILPSFIDGGKLGDKKHDIYIICE